MILPLQLQKKAILLKWTCHYLHPKIVFPSYRAVKWRYYLWLQVEIQVHKSLSNSLSHQKQFEHIVKIYSGKLIRKMWANLFVNVLNGNYSSFYVFTLWNFEYCRISPLSFFSISIKMPQIIFNLWGITFFDWNYPVLTVARSFIWYNCLRILTNCLLKVLRLSWSKNILFFRLHDKSFSRTPDIVIKKY